MVHGLALCLINYLLKVIKGTWAGVLPFFKILLKDFVKTKLSVFVYFLYLQQLSWMLAFLYLPVATFMEAFSHWVEPLPVKLLLCSSL